ncbi:MAG: hypothetical protein E7256_12575 [Lachnospiraceae bacterium]|nr:hypothetical protein [Lachnospiraceae bacterium]
MRKAGKRMLYIGAGIIVLTGLLYTGYQKFVDPRRDAVSAMKESISLTDTMTKAEAKEDLNYLMDKLRKFHPAWSDDTKNMTKQVEEQYQMELTNLDDTMSMLELWQAASRIVHQMSDAHTRVSTSRLDGEYRYRVAEDGITVSDMIAVNKEPMDEIKKRFLSLWPYELESYGIVRFEKYIVYQEYMELAGVDTTNGVDITYRLDGEEVTKHYEAEIWKDEAKDFVSYQINEAKNLGIFTLTSCKESSLYDERLQQFFAEVKEKGITNIAVDLRENNGGWIPAVKEFLTYVDTDTYTYCNNLRTRMGMFWYKEKEQIQNEKKTDAFSGNIYVLTSAKTFSSAMDFAMVIMDNDLGTIIGEIPGNMPDSYTINLKYQLPNSGLKLVVSGGEQNRIDETKSGQPLIPDYETEADEALNKVYELSEGEASHK